MKNFLVLLLLISFSASAQYDSTRQRQVNSSYGFDFKNVKVIGSNVIPLDTLKLAVRDSGAIAYKDGIVFVWNGHKWNVQNSGIIPSFCGVPTLRGSVVGNQAAIAFDSCNNKLYVYNPKDSTWKIQSVISVDSIFFSSSATVDTVKYIKNGSEYVAGYIDLSGYATKSALDDTANAIRGSFPAPVDISGKVNYTDTASMLTPYLRKNTVSGGTINQVLKKNSSTDYDWSWQDESGGGMKVVIQTYTGSSSITIADSTTWLIINPASLAAAMTITLPESPTNGQDVVISFGGTITTGTVVTALTVSPNTGQVIIQASTPVDVQAGEMIAYRFTNSKWYRQ